MDTESPCYLRRVAAPGMLVQITAALLVYVQQCVLNGLRGTVHGMPDGRGSGRLEVFVDCAWFAGHMPQRLLRRAKLYYSYVGHS